MIGAIIQARMGSSRFPGKVMKNITTEKKIIDFVIEQLNYTKNLDRIIVATTELEEDDVIYNHVKTKNVECFRGSSENVLERFYFLAKKYSINTIVRITADNPLIDPTIVDNHVKIFEESNVDLVTNTINRTFPFGTEVEVFSFESLRKAWENAKMPSEQEHVTPFIRNKINKFKCKNIENEVDFSHLRYTVDKERDLELVKEIVNNIAKKPILFSHIQDLYKQKPEIFEINRNVEHDGYKSSLQKDQEYLKSSKEKNIP